MINLYEMSRNKQFYRNMKGISSHVELQRLTGECGVTTDESKVSFLGIMQVFFKCLQGWVQNSVNI